MNFDEPKGEEQKQEADRCQGQLARIRSHARASSRLFLALIPLMAGCATKAALPPTSGPVGQPEAALHVAAPQADIPEAATTTKMAVLWQQAFDLDGDGDVENVQLLSEQRFDTESKDRQIQDDGNLQLGSCLAPEGDVCKITVVVDEASHELTLQSGYWFGINLQLVDVDPADPSKQLLFRYRLARAGGQTTEDPPFVFHLASFSKGQLSWHDLWHGMGYNAGTIEFPGDGTLVTRYDECPDVATNRYRLSGSKLRAEPQTRVATQDPGACAACPFVYVFKTGAFKKRGEILRDLRAPRHKGLQALPLGRVYDLVVGETVIIELREEKDEVSYVDRVFLSMDGKIIKPKSCLTSQNGPHCASDKDRLAMKRGDKLRLVFNVKGWTEMSRVELWADGYYTPNPT